MPHFPKPFFRSSRQLWYVQLHGKQINLGPERDEAFRKYGELISKPAPPKLRGDSVAVLLDQFLDWCELHRAKRTYEWHKERCQSFLDSIPPTLTVAELKPFHVQQWVDSKNWSDGMKRGAMISVQRAFNWLSKQGRIPQSPLAGLEKPAQGRRERVLSEQEYRSILGRFDDDPFADLLILAWETGARAQELWNLEARHVKDRQWIFPTDEAKGHKRQRIVYLNDTALLVTQKLMLKFPSGKLLRNEDGKPWTRHAVSCRFYRLKKKIGEKLCLTNFRHSFATRKLEEGTDSMIVAAMLGHKDLSMLGRVYAHPAHEVLIESVRKSGGA